MKESTSGTTEFPRWLLVLVRLRYAVLVLAGVLPGLRHVHLNGFPGDWHYFRSAAQVLVGRTGTHPLGVYVAAPDTQIGPPGLLLALPVALLPKELSEVVAVVLLGACLAVVCWLLERAAGGDGPTDPRTALTILGGGSFVAIYWWRVAAEFTHPEDVLALAVAAVVLGWSRRSSGRWAPWAAVVLLGLAAAGKPWAIGFLPLAAVWTAPWWIRCARVCLAGLVAAACWVPFLLAAPQTLPAISSFRLQVWWTAPLALVGLGDEPFPGWVRPLQFLVVLVLGTVAVLRGRAHLVPLATVAARIALDPQAWDYYFATVAVACLAVDVLRRRHRGPWLTMATVFVLHDARWLSNTWWVIGALQVVPLVIALVLLIGWRPRTRVPAWLRTTRLGTT